MRKWKMWAAINPGGTLVCWCWHAPIAWNRRVLNEHMKRLGWSNPKIIRVEVRELPKRKKGSHA